MKGETQDILIDAIAMENGFPNKDQIESEPFNEKKSPISYHDIFQSVSK